MIVASMTKNVANNRIGIILYLCQNKLMLAKPGKESMKEKGKIVGVGTSGRIHNTADHVERRRMGMDNGQLHTLISRTTRQKM